MVMKPYLLFFCGMIGPVSITALSIGAQAQESNPPSSSIIAAKLQPFVDEHTMAGAVVLVATKDKVLDLEAVGYADLAQNKPMQTDDIFWIASMSKPMTATALMMLVDEGKVSVDDPVERYLPEFKGQMVIDPKDLAKTPHPPNHPILIRNILSHTSGLPPISPVEKPTLDLLPLSEAVRAHARDALRFQPDTEYEYSNAGINTAGRIVEVVSGMPYEKFMEERLFQPLGMKDTTFWPNAEQLKRLAKSYKENAAKNGLEELNIGQLHYPLDDTKVRFPMPAGGLFSTASDVAKFGQMILNGGMFEGKRYLSEAAVHQMTSRQTGNNIKASYGFGWSVGDRGFGHGGAYKTDLHIDPRLGLVTVFMVQQGSNWPNSDGSKILPAFHAAAAAEAPPSMPPPPKI